MTHAFLWLALWAGRGQAATHVTKTTIEDGGPPVSMLAVPVNDSPVPKCYQASSMTDVIIEIPCPAVAAPKPEPRKVTCTHNQERCGTSTQCKSLYWTIFEPAYCDYDGLYGADSKPFPSKVLETATCDYFEGGYVKGIKQDQVICPWTHVPEGWKPPKPEPMVVPAIPSRHSEGYWCDGNTGQTRWDNPPADFKQGNGVCSMPNAEEIAAHRITWSCPKHYRKLGVLQTEDGKRICVKFGDEK